MTIKQKIWAIPVLILIIFTGMLITIQKYSNETYSDITMMRNVEYPYLRQVEQLALAVSNIQQNLDAAVSTSDTDFIELAQNSAKTFEDTVGNIRLNTDKAALANQFSQMFNLFMSKALILTDDLINNNPIDVSKESRQMINALQALQALLQQEINGSNKRFDNAFSQIIEHTDDITVLNIILGIILGLSVSIISYLIIRSIFKRFDILQKGAARIAAGDYSGNFPTDGNDELTKVMTGFNTMESTLRNAVSTQVKTQRMLETLNQELELRVRKRTNKLSKTLEELKQMQNQLLQSEKLASLGQLSAGVAHEINNPIGFISSNMNSLSQYINEIFKLLGTYEEAESQLQDSQLLINIQTIKEEVDINFIKGDIKDLILESEDGISRVKKIVQDLKNFCHVDDEEWQLSDIHNGIDSTLNIAQNEIKYKANVIKEYGDIPLVECILSQLNQVFMNLLVNAAHAIEEQGTITIRTGQDENNWVWIQISDTGKGIEEEHLKNIFDPFFTSKAIGEGTGLGLSLSYGIIQKHNGRIEVDTTVGKGSTFTVWIPLKQSKPLPETPIQVQ